MGFCYQASKASSILANPRRQINWHGFVSQPIFCHSLSQAQDGWVCIKLQNFKGLFKFFSRQIFGWVSERAYWVSNAFLGWFHRWLDCWLVVCSNTAQTSKLESEPSNLSWLKEHLAWCLTWLDTIQWGVKVLGGWGQIYNLAMKFTRQTCINGIHKALVSNCDWLFNMRHQEHDNLT